MSLFWWGFCAGLITEGAVLVGIIALGSIAEVGDEDIRIRRELEHQRHGQWRDFL